MKRTTIALIAGALLATAAGVAVAVPSFADGGWRGPAGGSAEPWHGGHHGGPPGPHHGGSGDHSGGHGPALFESFDKNQDGKLTQAEIDEVRAERFGRFDADKSQGLSLPEYQALWLDAMREQMVRAFQRLDRDGDGTVTAEEFKRPYAGVVRHMDRNDDGAIDRGDMRRPGHGPGPGPGPGRAPN